MKPLSPMLVLTLNEAILLQRRSRFGGGRGETEKGVLLEDLPVPWKFKDLLLFLARIIVVDLCIRTLNSEGENGVAGNGNGDDRAQAGRQART